MPSEDTGFCVLDLFYFCLPQISYSQDWQKSKFAFAQIGILMIFIFLEKDGIKLIIPSVCASCEGLLQKTILESVGCIWFNRSEAKDREIVAKK